jgi:hypothetical protein
VAELAAQVPELDAGCQEMRGERVAEVLERPPTEVRLRCDPAHSRRDRHPGHPLPHLRGRPDDPVADAIVVSDSGYNYLAPEPTLPMLECTAVATCLALRIRLR